MKVLEAAKKNIIFKFIILVLVLAVHVYQLIHINYLTLQNELGSNLSIIESGRKINEKMPEHVIKITLDAFEE